MTLPIWSFILWSTGIGFMCFCIGWRGGEARSERKHADLRELRMMIRDSINHNNSELVEAEVREAQELA